MTDMWNYFITSVLLILKCNAIEVEYYDGKNWPEKQSEDIISDARRLSGDDTLKNSSLMDQNVTHYLELSVTEKYNLFMSSDVGEENKEELTKNDLKDNSKLSTKLNITLLSLDNLVSYEYNDEYYADVKQPLREKVPQVEKNNISRIVGSSIKSDITEFYNLEPAIKHIDKYITDGDHNYTKGLKQWYVLENQPCWNLPLLYGELGKRKVLSEVFLVHGVKLKNVVEKDGFSEYIPRSQIVAVGDFYTTNKWCKSEPCYGDHTLCLFSEKSNYALCDEDYKVVTPGILEQTALVNTLNSMRNKIANGESERYSHLSPAANMKQILYDYDLQKMAKVWLHQCLPGPAPCSSLESAFVTQLECTKYVKLCCIKSYTAKPTKCIPKPECYINPVIGCLHVWFWKAGKNLTTTDVQCGHTSVKTYSTAQLIWANTYKIGCAYAMKKHGDVRIICNFSPGAPFALETRFYCGLIAIKNTTILPNENNITDEDALKSLGIHFDREISDKLSIRKLNTQKKLKGVKKMVNNGEIYILSELYSEGWVNNALKDNVNGTRGLNARLVLKYEFLEQNEARCDSHDSIYAIGATGSMCEERGRRYQGLCYDFRDPTPGYRQVAILSTMILFSLILYDLFSGIVRQTSNS